MIYTATFNPSLDYVMFLPELKTASVNRAERESIYPGGKGINVSIVLTRLGQQSTALGFTAGFTGRALKSMLEGVIATDFITLPAGETRIDVKLRAGEETDINGQGPDIPASCLEKFYEKISSFKEGDALVLAGSIPSSLPENIYEEILGRLDGRGVDCVVDATGELLKMSLRHKPFLVKPNLGELAEMFGVAITNRDEVVKYAKKTRELGAQNVLVSMDSRGALLVSAEGDVIEGRAPAGRLVNSVGAGDSMVAGFLAGYKATGSYARALSLGLAAGSATAFNEWLAEKADVAALLDRPSDFGL
jgi:1-phosphofructokinase